LRRRRCEINHELKHRQLLSRRINRLLVFDNNPCMIKISKRSNNQQLVTPSSLCCSTRPSQALFSTRFIQTSFSAVALSYRSTVMRQEAQ
jgi:hypothetical protein